MHKVRILVLVLVAVVPIIDNAIFLFPNGMTDAQLWNVWFMADYTHRALQAVSLALFSAVSVWYYETRVNYLCILLAAYNVKEALNYVVSGDKGFEPGFIGLYYLLFGWIVYRGWIR